MFFCFPIPGLGLHVELNTWGAQALRCVSGFVEVALMSVAMRCPFRQCGGESMSSRRFRIMNLGQL